jgi:hypothetical protein
VEVCERRLRPLTAMHRYDHLRRSHADLLQRFLTASKQRLYPVAVLRCCSRFSSARGLAAACEHLLRRGLCLSAITDRVQGRGPMAKRGEQGRRITPCDFRRGRAGEEKRSDQGLVPDRSLYPETWVVTLDGQVSMGALIGRAGVSWSAWVATGRRCTAPLAFASRRPAATGQRRLQHPARRTELQPGGRSVIRP